MANPNFDPEYSSNSVWYDTNMNECLTDHIDDIESDINGLQSSKANTNHVHTAYASVNHTHSYNDLENKPSIPTTLPANGGNADTVDGKHASDFATASYVNEKFASIVTTGTHGTWKYRKWSNGIAEQWGPVVKHGLSNWIEWGGWYYAYDTVTFDTGIFIEAPRVFITSVGRTWCIPLTQDVTYQQFTLCGLRPAAGESSYWFDVYAIGRWK